MKQVFMVVGEVRDWLNTGVVDSDTSAKSRLYTTTTLVAMGIIAAYQSGIPATLKNLQRITGFSSMQIYRGTTTLTNKGFLDRDDEGVWFWSVEVPKDILDIHPVPAVTNDSSNDELKAFIVEALSNIQLPTPNGQAKIEQMVEKVKHFPPVQTKPRAEKGPKALFGDAVLDIDGSDEG